MKLIYSDHFKKRLAKLLSKNPKLKNKISKQLKLLINFGFEYPSLKTHKLKGKYINQYAIWILGDLRIILMLVEDGYLLIDVINHDEY